MFQNLKRVREYYWITLFNNPIEYSLLALGIILLVKLKDRLTYIKYTLYKSEKIMTSLINLETYHSLTSILAIVVLTLMLGLLIIFYRENKINKQKTLFKEKENMSFLNFSLISLYIISLIILVFLLVFPLYPKTYYKVLLSKDSYGLVLLTFLLFYIHSKLAYSFVYYRQNTDFYECIKLSYGKTKEKEYNLFQILIAQILSLYLIWFMFYLVQYYVGKMVDFEVLKIILRSSYSLVIVFSLSLSFFVVKRIVEDKYSNKEIVVQDKEMISIEQKLFILFVCVSILTLQFNAISSDQKRDSIKLISYKVNLNAIKSNNNFIDYYEIDIRRTKDGKLVVYPDSNIRKNTGIDKSIDDLNLQELKSIINFSDNSKIEFLELDAYLKYISNLDQSLLIEAKDLCKDGELDMLTEVLALSNSLNVESKIMVKTRRKEVIDALNYDYDHIPVGYVTGFLSQNNIEVNADFFTVENYTKNEYNIKSLKSKGKPIYIFVTDVDELAELVYNTEVDGVITDHYYAMENLIRKMDTEIMIDCIFDDEILNR